jgi:hypothetical protein
MPETAGRKARQKFLRILRVTIFSVTRWFPLPQTQIRANASTVLKRL